MAFSEATILSAWTRSGGKCECGRISHGHGIWGCNKQLIWESRGKDYLPGGWEAHHKTAVSAGGGDTVSNCEILCLACHKGTQSYGE